MYMRLSDRGLRGRRRRARLETRQLLSNTFKVTSAVDSEDAGTLRWAIHQVDDVKIGGTAAGAGNVIAYNGESGISVGGLDIAGIAGLATAAGPVTISRNSPFANTSSYSPFDMSGGYGDIVGSTAGPVITSVTSSAGSTIVTGTVTGTPNTPLLS